MTTHYTLTRAQLTSLLRAAITEYIEGPSEFDEAHATAVIGGTLVNLDAAAPSYEQAMLAWDDGDISDGEALRALAPALADVERAMAPLEAQKQALRGALHSIVARLGGKAELAGVGSYSITAGGVAVSYDVKALDSLQAMLLRAGDIETAQAIADARKESPRAASLRVVKEKAK